MTPATAVAARPAAPLVVWHTLRPRSLVVSVLPVVVGTAALVPEGTQRPVVALACLVVAVLLQAGTNAVNDAEDAATGADAAPGALPSLALRRGWVTPTVAGRVGLVALGLAAVAGLLLALVVGKPALLALGAAGVVTGWAYTAPPLRLAYRPLGEVASGWPMGFGITWGTAAAQAASVPRSVYWATGPLMLLTAAILHANNARDREHDRGVGKRTLATYLGSAGVTWEFRLLTGLVPVVVLAGLLTGGLPWTCAVALLPGAMALRTAAATPVALQARGWTLRLRACVRLHTLCALALAVGLVAHRAV